MEQEGLKRQYEKLLGNAICRAYEKEVFSFAAYVLKRLRALQRYVGAYRGRK